MRNKKENDDVRNCVFARTSSYCVIGYVPAYHSRSKYKKSGKLISQLSA